MKLDTVSWVAIGIGVLILVVTGIVDYVEHKKDPNLVYRMEGAIWFAAAFFMGALLR